MPSWAMRRLGGDSCSSGEADSFKDNQGPLRSFLSRYWRRMLALIGVERACGWTRDARPRDSPSFASMANGAIDVDAEVALYRIGADAAPAAFAQKSKLGKRLCLQP